MLACLTTPGVTRKAHDMTDSQSRSWAIRVVCWVLLTALFLAVGLLPNLLLAWFYTAWTVHSVVVPTVAVILIFIWGTARLAPSQ